MKTIKTINRRSPLFVWAYLFEDREHVSQTDSCSLFWRSVVLTPVKLLGVAGFGFVVATACASFWLEAWSILAWTLAGISSFGLLVGAGMGVHKAHKVAVERNICAIRRVI